MTPTAFSNPSISLILAILLLCGEAVSASAELPVNLIQAIGILAEYKSNAEQQARILVGLAADGDISKNNYRKGQSLYGQAKAAFDGWIDRLVFEIHARQSDHLPPDYDIIQKAAKAKGDAFTFFVQEEFLGESRRGEVARSFKSLFASITDVGQLVVNGYAQSSTPARAEAIEKLESYKWPAFHIIEQNLKSVRDEPD